MTGMINMAHDEPLPIIDAIHLIHVEFTDRALFHYPQQERIDRELETFGQIR